MWSSYKGSVQGVKVEGDKSAPPTKWYNHLILALWGWKVVTVFEVSEGAARIGYQVGYMPFDGKGMVESKVNYDRRFRMKNGHEDCTFFAVNPKGEEVALKVVTRTMKDDPAYQDAPLH